MSLASDLGDLPEVPLPTRSTAGRSREQISALEPEAERPLIGPVAASLLHRYLSVPSNGLLHSLVTRSAAPLVGDTNPVPAGAMRSTAYPR